MKCHVWLSMVMYEQVWSCMVVYGHAWLYMSKYGLAWLYMVMSCHVWLYKVMIMYNDVWCMVKYGLVWSCMILYCSVSSVCGIYRENKLRLSCAKLRASLNLFGFDKILNYFDKLTYFKFANLSYELNFGALLLLLLKVLFGILCSVWYTWFGRWFGLKDLAWFALIEVVFIF